MAQFIVTVDDVNVKHYGTSVQMAEVIKAQLGVHYPVQVEPYEDSEESVVESDS